jgi:hypothetical protein
MPVPQVDTPTARALEDGGTVQFGIEGPSVLTAVAHVNPRSRRISGAVAVRAVSVGAGSLH